MDREKRSIWSRILPDGQVTVPAEVMETLGLTKGGSVVFRIDDGAVMFRKPQLEDVLGSVPPLKKPKTCEEIDQIIQDDVAEEYRRKMLEGNA